MKKVFQAQLISKKEIAPDRFELTFSKPNGFIFEPGQYVWIHVPFKYTAESVDRQAFSLCSLPSDPTLQIIFRNTGSPFKKSLLELPIQEFVTLHGPFGSRKFPEDISVPVVCVAGGIGIAPFLSLIKNELLKNNSRPISLLYANHDAQTVVYEKELQTLQQQFPNFHITFVVGHITKEVLNKIALESSEWYIIGPQGMCTEVANLLRENGVNNASLHFEEYYPKAPQEFDISNDINIFKLAVENSSNHIVLTDVNGYIIYANHAAESITGYSFAEMKGQTPRLWGGLMSADFYKEMWDTIKNNQKPFYGEITNRRKNGELYTALTRISPILQNTELKGFLGTEEDISVRVTAEENFRKVQERFQGIYDSSTDGIAFSSLEGKLLDANTAYCQMLGYSLDELLEKTYQELTPPEYSAIEAQYMKQLEERGKAVEYEKEYLTKAGKKIPVSITVFLVHNAKGESIGFARLIKDISDRKRYETEILAHTQQVEEEILRDDAILASIGDGMVVIDADAKVLLMNSACEEMLHVKKEDLIGKNFIQTIKLYDENNSLIPDEESSLLQSLKERKKIEKVVIYQANDKSIYLGTTVTPFILNGNTIGAIEVFRDMTKLKAVDRMKTEFISLASHQLRTPLSAMRWFSEMLLNGDAGELTKEQKEYMQNISDSNERMIMLVNSLLNISRIESGRIIIDPKPTDLQALLETIIKEVQMKANAKNQKIIISVHEQLPLINLDEKLIREVYLNLLTNAIKYTPNGGEITIFISKKDNDILSNVTDTGYGILEKEKKNVFEKFFRGENIIKVETDGTGLGLYLVKAIIESSGGKIWFESEVNKGTTFWFTLPIIGVKPHDGEVVLNS